MQFRDRFSDFILILVKEILVKYKHIKIVLIGTPSFSEPIQKFFPQCPIMISKEIKHIYVLLSNAKSNATIN